MPYASTQGTNNGRNTDIYEVVGNTTLVPNDNGKCLRVNKATGVNITAPANVLGQGFKVDIEQHGAGVVTIISDGTSVLRSRGGLVATNGQYAKIRVETIKPNEFLITGDRA